MSGFECFGSTVGFLCADKDMSNAAHQFTPVWLGIGTSGTPTRGNAAILKKGPAGEDGAGEIKGAPLGILQNRPVKGEACTVMIRDVSMCLAGSDWTPGDTIGVDADGNAVKVDGAGFAIAVESAAKGDISTILLLPRAAS